MRIFILILSLIFSAAFVLLNILGFNGILTYNEFFLVNVIADVLVCLVLGHFMFRTYANHKKSKKLQQELTTLQASTVAQEQRTKKNDNAPSAPQAAPSQQPTAPQNPQQQEHAARSAHTPAQPTEPCIAPPRAPHVAERTDQAAVTQQMKPVAPPASDMDSTTLYHTPFSK